MATSPATRAGAGAGAGSAVTARPWISSQYCDMAAVDSKLCRCLVSSAWALLAPVTTCCSSGLGTCVAAGRRAGARRGGSKQLPLPCAGGSDGIGDGVDATTLVVKSSGKGAGSWTSGSFATLMLLIMALSSAALCSRGGSIPVQRAFALTLKLPSETGGSCPAGGATGCCSSQSGWCGDGRLLAAGGAEQLTPAGTGAPAGLQGWSNTISG
jgi:hypothetical protein